MFNLYKGSDCDVPTNDVPHVGLSGVMSAGQEIDELNSRLL